MVRPTTYSRAALEDLRLLCAVIALTLIVVVSCDDFPVLTFTNESGDDVTVHWGFSDPFSLGPGESRTIGVTRAAWPRTIAALDLDGVQVFCRTFSLEEVEEMDLEVVIERAVDANCAVTPTPA